MPGQAELLHRERTSEAVDGEPDFLGTLGQPVGMADAGYPPISGGLKYLPIQHELYGFDHEPDEVAAGHERLTPIGEQGCLVALVCDG